VSDIPPVPRAVPTAKDVAKQLESRARRRKVVLLLALAVVVALAIVYGTCGHGWGLGAGGGTGEGDGTTTVAADAGLRRCAIQVAAEGITVDGAKLTRDEAVAACKKAGAGADVIVTGDAREGDWRELETALKAATIEIFVRGPK
jgi:hypothetical protein